MRKYFYTLFVALSGFYVPVFSQATCSGDPNPGTIHTQDSLPCAGDSVFLRLHGLTETGLTFQWEQSPDGSTYTGIGGAIDSTYSDTIYHTTWFRCAVTCVSSGSTVYGAARQIVVSGLAPTGGSISWGHTGTTYHYSVTGIPSGVYSYSWDFGDGGTATTANASHTYATAGTYTVTVVVFNGCGGDTLQTSTVVAGVTSLSESVGILIFPNPATDGFNLSSKNLRQLDRLRITDMSGRVYWTQKNPIALPVYFSAQSLGLVNGTYFVEFSSGTQTGFLRLVVQ